MFIDNFIGVFPNAIPHDVCDGIVNHFNDLNSPVFSRQEHENTSKLEKDTDILFMLDVKYREEVRIFSEAFWHCYKYYSEKYPILDNVSSHQFYHDVKVQRTLPSGGYHVWHCEHDSRSHGSRLLLAIGYLNDVEQGGETEFLYQSLRVKPEKGTIIICPSSFTHTHRGNPPLTGDKYIINGWVEYVE